MTKPRPNIYEAMQAATEEALKHVVELAFDETADDDVRTKAARALIDVGWGPLPLTWRDWIRHPIRSFRRWRRWL